MPPVITLLLLLGLTCAALAALVARRRRAQFPPVVELAHTAPLPRLGFKIAALTAHKAPPTVEASQPDGPTAAEAPSGIPTVNRPPDPIEGNASLVPAQESGVSAGSVYEMHSSPYAFNGVQGGHITLSDDGEDDLPIRFRSQDPHAIPIAEQGDTAFEVKVADADGRIQMTASGNIEFVGPTD